jgi:hypothetical protein
MDSRRLTTAEGLESRFTCSARSASKLLAMSQAGFAARL